MSTLRIQSWNVNGLRAALKTGDFQRWLAESRPDIAGLQEVKALPEQVDSDPWGPEGYQVWWHPAQRPGYSGAMLLSKVAPLDVRCGLGDDRFDREGRVIEADLESFTLLTAYFPNSGRKGVRLDHKLAFCETFMARVDTLREQKRPVVFMGDLNAAHSEVDLARPEENQKSPGFLPEERDWVTRFIERGFVDTFRTLHPDAHDAYTYWDPWRDRRARNVGWRIDYVFVSEDLMPRVREAFIEPQVMGSDHCPVGIVLEA